VAGFFLSGGIFYILNLLFPVRDMDQTDTTDVYGTFAEAEARRIGVAPLEESSIYGLPKQSGNAIVVDDEKTV
jgi:NCS1 family nucleobase:cation symporter-1